MNPEEPPISRLTQMENGTMISFISKSAQIVVSCFYNRKTFQVLGRFFIERFYKNAILLFEENT